ncbi:MAG: oligosaccharide flippase family protein, partial [Thermoleophilia bacterium]|nr:oligosaccharide flippase family protein [Thermoleophilia bacterium]
ALVDSASVLVGAGTAVLLAVLGVEAEAIVAGGLSAALAATVVAVVSAPPAPPKPSRRGISEVGSFALPVTLSSLVYSTFRNVDYAILGARMSAADVGFYLRAHQLGVDYQSKISQVMLRVSFPVYSRSENLDDFRRMRVRIVRVHATVLVPLLAAFVALAPIVIPWLFGPAWEPAVVPAQIMAVAGIGDALVTGTGPLLVALGRPGILLAWNVFELAVFVPMIFLLTPYGLIAVSIGVAVFSVVTVILTWALLIRPLVGVSVRQLALEVVPGFVVGACVVGVLSAARSALDDAGLPTVVLLGALSLLGLAVYIASLRMLFSAVWEDVVLIFRRVRGVDPARLPEDGAETPAARA